MMMKHQSACDLSRFCHQFGAVPDSLELLRYWKLPLYNNQEYNCKTKTLHVKDSGKHSAEKEANIVSTCPLSLTLTYSSSCGIRMFISELLALTMSQLRESLLRQTWQPSVLLMEMVGTLPNTQNNILQFIDRYVWRHLMIPNLMQTPDL